VPTDLQTRPLQYDEPKQTDQPIIDIGLAALTGLSWLVARQRLVTLSRIYDVPSKLRLEPQDRLPAYCGDWRRFRHSRRITLNVPHLLGRRSDLKLAQPPRSAAW